MAASLSIFVIGLALGYTLGAWREASRPPRYEH